ncbi:aromatic amino acid exporter YddG [Celeribacter litoreus]|uniref:aromatic amino acid exporter YddG n=1 Tax=Celeribacter litoreus TaxID=2876714 RepID=UPI001CC989AF|nr:EamA family transporter [Celeribacter litoreus]MCA0044329.1 EamA family transporter [Celeribacter litoreus]
MTRQTATLIGFIAVLSWALLALFTVGSAPVPPLQLNAICFAIAAVIGFAWIWRKKAWHELRSVSAGVYAFGSLGIFGFHFLFFSALRHAPAAEASLINYLWPLLIVLFSGLLPGERLRPLHILGALMGFAGAALVIAGSASFTSSAFVGYAYALSAAFAWSSYSVLSRRLGHVTTASVAVFCLLASLLATVTHVMFEATKWPATSIGWISVLALGLGPVGGAFYLWDIGVKRGDIQLLGTASYAAPLLSTLALILAGISELRLTLVLAAALITAGAGLAAVASRQTR